MQLFVSGSLAYDRIMTFPGRFQDHILPDKIHILNVCFLVDGLEEKFGGTAGNIAYSLRLLEESPLILSSVGKDFDNYATYLRQLGLSLEGIRTIDREFTAGAYITTDKSDNQITGFNPGAMKFPSEFSFTRTAPNGALAIVSPGNLTDMVEYCRAYREQNIPYIFDPGQQIPVFSKEQLLECLSGSMMLVTNDYELEMVAKATGKTRAELGALTGSTVTTLGEQGSRLVVKGEEFAIPPAPVSRVLDPTGAGDAFRAGLIKGLCLDLTLERALRMGSVAASYAVEYHGTQEHTYTLAEFKTRYKDAFGSEPF